MVNLVGYLIGFISMGISLALSIVGGVIGVLFLRAFIAGTVFYFLWHWAAPLYFAFLPVKYVTLPWLHAVLLTWLFQIIGGILFKSTASSAKSN